MQVSDVLRIKRLATISQLYYSICTVLTYNFSFVRFMFRSRLVKVIRGQVVLGILSLIIFRKHEKPGITCFCLSIPVKKIIMLGMEVIVKEYLSRGCTKEQTTLKILSLR